MHTSLGSVAAIALACALLLLTACSPTPRNTQQPTKLFRAGAAAVDITPQKLPVIVNGGMRERTASKVHDPLHARCLVLDDGSTRIAFAIVDNCLVPRPLFDEAKHLAHHKTGIPAHRMLMAATHAHSCPSVCAILGSGQNDDYIRTLPGRIAQGIEQACKNLAPARIGWAVDQDPKNVFNRRWLMKPGKARSCRFTGKTGDRAQMNPGYQNPNAVERTGPRDTDVSVLAVQRPDGTPVAVLANYSTHYAGAPALSADYFGVFAQEIAKLVGAKDGDPPFVGLMTNGTSGDTNCCDFANPRRKFSYVTVGEDVAQAALRAYRRMEFHDWVPLAMEESLLTLEVRMPTAAEVAEARAFLAPFKGRKPRTVEEVYAWETVHLSQMPPTRELKLQAIRIGGLGIAAIPNEVFTVTGLAIKKHSPLRPSFTIELANGCDGYLPPPDQHALGGYTTWRARSSCLEERAEPQIRARVLALLRRLARP